MNKNLTIFFPFHIFSTMKKVILFVDDEILILFHLKEQVKRYFGDEFRYETAINANEAWEIVQELEREGVDSITIVSDWIMPDIQGDSFLRSVSKKFPSIRMILISGHVRLQDVENLKKDIHLHGFLTKPWNEKELICLLESEA